MSDSYLIPQHDSPPASLSPSRPGPRDDDETSTSLGRLPASIGSDAAAAATTTTIDDSKEPLINVAAIDQQHVSDTFDARETQPSRHVAADPAGYAGGPHTNTSGLEAHVALSSTSTHALQPSSSPTETTSRISDPKLVTTDPVAVASRQAASPSLLSQALAFVRGNPQSVSGQHSNAQPKTHQHVDDPKLNLHVQDDRESSSYRDTSSSPFPAASSENLVQRRSQNFLGRQSTPPQPAAQADMAASTMTTAPQATPILAESSMPAVPIRPAGTTLDGVNKVVGGRRNQQHPALPIAESQRETAVPLESTHALGDDTVFSTSPEEATTPTRRSYLESRGLSVPDEPKDDTGTHSSTTAEHYNRQESRRAAGSEKREKIWSIRTSGEAHEEDGQVEKSVAEAMAGVEPYARSRKASYSLRFFKEGMPRDETSRRRDGKSAQREKLSPTAEEGLQRSRSSTLEGERHVEPRNFQQVADSSTSAFSSTTTNATASPVDDVVSSPSFHKESAPSTQLEPKSDSDHSAAIPETSHVPAPSKHPVATGGKRPSKLDLKENKRNLVGGTEPVTASSSAQPLEDALQERAVHAPLEAEEGEADESGEEKISSAVFMPHQEAGSDSHSKPGDILGHRTPTRSRTLSKSESHPWLVKADEPEPEPESASQEDQPNTSQLHDTPRQPSANPDRRPAFPVDRKDEGALLKDEVVANAVQTGRPVLLPEGIVKDHESQSQAPQPQPREAIELIPYKHQVGGHTTLWRFSRRAVCKQLNNRENEFYETIERYHRDLLPFLPRYIGVLNVTFQKQPRRRSTSKKDDSAAAERKKIRDHLASAGSNPDTPAIEGASKESTPAARVVSQSLSHSNIPIPTVTFNNNKHILPRNLLQPILPVESSRRRSIPSARLCELPERPASASQIRPHLDDRPNSWGATTINKRLRNEVFNDAFLKQPVEVQKHRRPHQRNIPRLAQKQIVRPATSDPNLGQAIDPNPGDVSTQPVVPDPPVTLHGHTQSDLGSEYRTFAYPRPRGLDTMDHLKDLSGTSAPEPDTFKDSLMADKKKRRYSAGGLRRRPEDVRESRGDLKYFEEADDVAARKSHDEAEPDMPTLNRIASSLSQAGQARQDAQTEQSNLAEPVETSNDVAGLLSPSGGEIRKILRPINPKEANTQRDRVEYFLLLEDLTAGMKRPCMMDLKMGTRQYGMEATLKKQKSQQEKCRTTTSAELGVRVCGLQVWNSRTGEYDFQDKYYGRKLKVGAEFQGALQKFLYNGADLQSVLRHIPVVLRKISQLEQIVRDMNGYRFYAASLLMFYDGDISQDSTSDYDTVYESTTDAATDTEESWRAKKKNKSEIDFKIADFANSLTPLDDLRDKPCPPQHPDQPDGGFLKGLRSLRKYFLQIQRDVRVELGLDPLGRAASRLAVEMEEDVDGDMISN